MKDWSRRIFDALISLPEGTTYNAYLVKGAEKTALVDAVNPGFEIEVVGSLESDGSEPVDAPLCELADQLVAALGD